MVAVGAAPHGCTSKRRPRILWETGPFAGFPQVRQLPQRRPIRCAAAALDFARGPGLATLRQNGGVRSWQKNDRRQGIVAAVRAGASQRATARRFRVALSTVQRWLERAQAAALDEVDWGDRLHTAHHVRRTSSLLEDAIVNLRRELEMGALGEHGAAAIHHELRLRGWQHVPCIRTIGRILERRGLLDGRQRVRRRPPPTGWYLPDLAAREVELDSFDVVEGLVIRGGINVEVFNGISVYGGLVTSWPREGPVTARSTVEDLVAHWRAAGLPRYAQFDNDTRFQGAHQHRDSISRVMRLCLSLRVVPVFAPPQETGFQAAIESYNGRWQTKVWSRFQHESLLSLQKRSHDYVQAYRQRAAARIDAAPTRRAFPTSWELDLQAHPTGRLVYLRRTSDHGYVNLLGRAFPVDRLWAHRLVRAEVQLDRGKVCFFALRRRDPSSQPLLAEATYELPRRPFHG